MRRYTLHKDSRLKSQKSISEAFVGGKSIQVYPIRVYFYHLPTTDHAGVKAAFVAPKKNFKKAVDRNRIKRQLREAYRLNQYLLKDEIPDAWQVNVVFLYYIREKLNYTVIEKATQKVLKRLAKEMNVKQ
ncbi:MAG: ribonuclease P protein component [Saprospiraceae bacterium]|nr:ribonuclease P protein component [Saprospiraceae bacterium]